MPDLTDGAVLLRAWRAEDADWYADESKDPEIQRLTGEPPDLTGAQVRTAIAAAGDGAWVITDAATGDRLGNAALDVATGSVSYWIAASARGRGAATRAVTLMREYADRELTLWVRAGNVASARVAAKAGFVRAPELDRPITVKGEEWQAEYWRSA